MTEPIERVPSLLPCKCCGGLARLFDVVDFHKNAEIVRGREVLDLCGLPVYYHRCIACGFIFTAAFDHFSTGDLAEFVYNDDYILVDPEYADFRPRENGRAVAEMFRGWEDLRILDFGGGTGLLAGHLREAGFASVEVYDPFVPGSSELPRGRFDLILAFEVLEHTRDPRGTMEQIDSLLEPGGMVLFSTLLQPEDIETIRLSWWYAAPRNGHFSLYSRQSLTVVAESLGFSFGSSNENLHVLFRAVPDFARHLFRAAA